MKAYAKGRRLSDGDFQRIMRGDTDLNWYNAQIQRATFQTKRGKNKRKKDRERQYAICFSL